MITCPECQQEELEGALFCSNCGASLLADSDDSRTNTLPFSQVPAPQNAPPLVGKKRGPAVDAAIIRFVIPSSGRQVTQPMQDQIRVGRADPQRGVFPELDLTGDGGSGAGISRLHAVILSTAQGIAIMDLDSVNGTKVNNYRLPPHLPYALNSGDELKLGSLLVHVFLEG